LERSSSPNFSSAVSRLFHFSFIYLFCSVSRNCFRVLLCIEILGKLLYEWLTRRSNQRGQCPHDPLTVYEAIHGTKQAQGANASFTHGSSNMVYVNGTIPFICTFFIRSFNLPRISVADVAGTILSTEWASFLLFFPHSDGLHRVAISVHDKDGWLAWLEATVLARVDEALLVVHSDVQTFGLA
jgi:hypothetical protein